MKNCIALVIIIKLSIYSTGRVYPSDLSQIVVIIDYDITWNDMACTAWGRLFKTNLFLERGRGVKMQVLSYSFFFIQFIIFVSFQLYSVNSDRFLTILINVFKQIKLTKSRWPKRYQTDWNKLIGSVYIFVYGKSLWKFEEKTNYQIALHRIYNVDNSNL